MLRQVPRRETTTHVTIDAPPEVVWDTLLDVGHYEWNPLLRFDGELRPGAPVRMRVLLGGRALPIMVRCESVEPERELSWRGGPAKLFCGHHYFRLRQHPSDPERTEVTHGEAFEGYAVAPAWPLLGGQMKSRYQAVNAALRREAEARHRR